MTTERRELFLRCVAGLQQLLEATTDLELSGPNANWTDVVREKLEDGRFDDAINEMFDKYPVDAAKDATTAAPPHNK